MKTIKPHKNKLANTVMEYVILIGIVSLGFIAMNTYIKRGLQGKVADMTDYFIGREHAADSNPTAEITSESKSAYTSNATTDLLAGGGMRLALLDTANTTSSSKIVDEPKAVTSDGYVPAERGYITPPERPTEEDIKEVYDTEAESKKAEVRILKTRRDNLLLEAKVLEEKAKIIDKKGRELISRANHMKCPRRHGGSCRQARRNLSQQGQQMVKDAAAMMQEVAQKRREANQLQARIDALSSEV